MAIKGPLPPSFTILGMNSKFAERPAASLIRSAKYRVSVMRVYSVAVCRWATTCRIVSTNPSNPTNAGQAASRAGASDNNRRALGRGHGENMKAEGRR